MKKFCAFSASKIKPKPKKECLASKHGAVMDLWDLAIFFSGQSLAKLSKTCVIFLEGLAHKDVKVVNTPAHSVSFISLEGILQPKCPQKCLQRQIFISF